MAANCGQLNSSKLHVGSGSQKVVRQAHAARKQNCSRQTLVCRSQKEANLWQTVSSKAAGAAAALALSLGGLSGTALASEFDIMNTPTPGLNYLIDDAGVVNKTTRKAVNDRLYKLESNTGYRVEVATVRKLEFEADAFAFGEKVLNKWYPDKSEGEKKGLLLVVTTGKEGAVVGGDAFQKAVGDTIIDSIIQDNIPVFTEQEKWNETLTSSIKRLEAALTGQKDPGAPARKEDNRQRTYKTKDEVEKTKPVYVTIVAVLLVIAFVVPMLQYFGYTRNF
jgi:uncharacterized membrane protein YgcG